MALVANANLEHEVRVSGGLPRHLLVVVVDLDLAVLVLTPVLVKLIGDLDAGGFESSLERVVRAAVEIFEVRLGHVEKREEGSVWTFELGPAVAHADQLANVALASHPLVVAEVDIERLASIEPVHDRITEAASTPLVDHRQRRSQLLRGALSFSQGLQVADGGDLAPRTRDAVLADEMLDRGGLVRVEAPGLARLVVLCDRHDGDIVEHDGASAKVRVERFSLSIIKAVHNLDRLGPGRVLVLEFGLDVGQPTAREVVSQVEGIGDAIGRIGPCQGLQEVRLARLVLADEARDIIDFDPAGVLDRAEVDDPGARKFHGQQTTISRPSDGSGTVGTLGNVSERQLAQVNGRDSGCQAKPTTDEGRSAPAPSGTWNCCRQEPGRTSGPQRRAGDSRIQALPAGRVNSSFSRAMPWRQTACCRTGHR